MCSSGVTVSGKTIFIKGAVVHAFTQARSCHPSVLGVSFPSFLLLIFFFHFFHNVLILGLPYYCLLVYCSNLLTGLWLLPELNILLHLWILMTPCINYLLLSFDELFYHMLSITIFSLLEFYHTEYLFFFLLFFCVSSVWTLLPFVVRIFQSVNVSPGIMTKSGNIKINIGKYNTFIYA